MFLKKLKKIYSLCSVAKYAHFVIVVKFNTKQQKDIFKFIKKLWSAFFGETGNEFGTGLLRVFGRKTFKLKNLRHGISLLLL